MRKKRLILKVDRTFNPDECTSSRERVLWLKTLREMFLRGSARNRRGLEASGTKER